MSNAKYHMSNGKHPPSHLSLPTSMKGFTFIEFLIIMSVVVLLGLTSVPFLSRFYTQNAVSNTYDQLAAELRKAQTYAMTGKQNGPWGVYYDGVGKITLYQGNSYATHTNTAYDESFSVNSNISISGFSDINFSQVTGTPSASPTITITGNNTTKTITVNNQGIINYALLISTPTPTPTIVPITHDADSSPTPGSNVTSLTWNHTIGSNTEMILIVGIGNTKGQTVSNVTYNGANLTKLTTFDCTNACHEEVWYETLQNPVAGTYSIVVTFSGITSSVAAGASTYFNVLQSTPLGTPATNNGTTNSPQPSVNVSTSNTSQLVVDAIVSRSGNVLSVGGSQTQRWNVIQPGNRVSAGSSLPANGGTTTMSWSAGTSTDWAEIGVPINHD